MKRKLLALYIGLVVLSTVVPAAGQIDFKRNHARLSALNSQGLSNLG